MSKKEKMCISSRFHLISLRIHKICPFSDIHDIFGVFFEFLKDFFFPVECKAQFIYECIEWTRFFVANVK